MSKLPLFSLAVLRGLGTGDIVVLVSIDGIEFTLSSKHLMSRLIILDELKFQHLGSIADHLKAYPDINKRIALRIEEKSLKQAADRAAGIDVNISEAVETDDMLLALRALYYITKIQDVKTFAGHSEEQIQVMLDTAIEEALLIDRNIKDIHHQIYRANILANEALEN